MIGNGVVVDIGQRAFFRPDAGREIAEVVDREGQIGGPCLADGLAIIQGFCQRQGFQVLLNHIGNLQQDCCAIGR